MLITTSPILNALLRFIATRMVVTPAAEVTEPATDIAPLLKS